MIVNVLLVLVIIALTFYYSYNTKQIKKAPNQKANKNNGKQGEALVSQKLKKHFSRHSYYLLDNVTLPTKDGGTTQIDHILVSKYGVFVIETKDYSGWIFGSKHGRKWTQSFPKKKYKFQNPIHQNNKHINELSMLFEIFDKKVFKSIIVFTNKSKFKSKEIKNVISVDKLTDYIKSFQEKELSQNKLYYIVGKIEVRRFRVSEITDDLHKFYLHEKFNKVNKAATNAAPQLEKTVV